MCVDTHVEINHSAVQIGSPRNLIEAIVIIIIITILSITIYNVTNILQKLANERVHVVESFPCISESNECECDCIFINVSVYTLFNTYKNV